MAKEKKSGVIVGRRKPSKTTLEAYAKSYDLGNRIGSIAVEILHLAAARFEKDETIHEEAFKQGVLVGMKRGEGR